MKFVESKDEPIEDWTPDQEAASTAVSEAIKVYIKTTESLATGKYGHLRDKIPEYMTNPGNVLIAVCSDGVVIRYEKKGHEERKLVVTVIQEGIARVASMLSQNLVHVQSPDAPHPLDENFGIELKLTVHTPSREYLVTWWQRASGSRW